MWLRDTLVKRLVSEWADAVAENYTPRAMKGFGLDYDALAVKPDLVMISACLNGQTGPHKDYPGFGGQGSALGGYNALTGWPDREPIGPYGTITDSLAPRYVAAALAAGLLYRRRTGKGVYLDIAQVESAHWSLSPWLLDYEVDGVIRLRDGNRHTRACPHGAFECADEGGIRDRWVAIACWDDAQWATLAALIGADDPSLAAFASRKARRRRGRSARDAVHRHRPRAEIAETLQAAGIEAVPVEDYGDLQDDPQLALRTHFERPHPRLPRLPPLRTQRLPSLGEPGRLRPVGADARPGQRLGPRDVLGCSEADARGPQSIGCGRVTRDPA